MSRKFIFTVLFALSVSTVADARVVFLPKAAESVGSGNSTTQTERNAQKCVNDGYTKIKGHTACLEGYNVEYCLSDHGYYKCVRDRNWAEKVQIDQVDPEGKFVSNP